MNKLLSLAGLCLSLLSINAFPASIVVKERGDYKFPTISISGPIENMDGDRFSSIANQYTNAIVELDSPGGSLLSGIQIGTVIRLRSFHTLVRNEKTCASACAYAWLAGTERYVQPAARIGFHAAYVLENGDTRETGVGNALLGSYLSRIALSDEAIVYFTSAAPNDMNWLNHQVATQLGLNIKEFSPSEVRNASNSRANSSPGGEQRLEATADLALRTTEMLKRYFSHWSADDKLALRFFDETLAPSVDFYGERRTKKSIIREKLAIMKRWPARAYIERPDSVKVNCDQTLKRCKVVGIIDWVVKSETRNAIASGISEFLFVVDYQTGSARVTSESGSVLQRNSH